MKTITRAIIVAVLAGLLGASAAWADGNPSVDQYVEQIPTSKGSKPTGGPAKTVTKLPAPVQESIQSEGGSDSQALEAVATSSSFGAPKQVRVKKHVRKRIERKLRPKTVQEANALPAAVGAVSGTGNGRLLALVIVMGAMAVVAVALAAFRRRSARR